MQTNLTGSFVFRIGAPEPFFRMIGLPGSWQSKATEIAEYFQCNPDDVSTRELAGDGVELILVCGNVVGSFDRPVELSELLAGSVS